MQVSIQAVDQSEASIHLHEHLAAGAGHGVPTLAELLHQAGHDVPPAPGLRLRAFKGENSWLLCEKYFSVLLPLTILQHGVCPPVHHDLGLPEQGVQRLLALVRHHHHHLGVGVLLLRHQPHEAVDGLPLALGLGVAAVLPSSRV